MQSRLTIVEETLDCLEAYGRVSIAFEVRSILELEVVDKGLGGLYLVERPAREPCVKDYDSCNGEGPTRLPERFDVTSWGFLSAMDGAERVGGCIIAHQTANCFTLEGRADLAALWDIRVTPARRGQGIGKRLFDAAVDWAKSRHCRQLKIETQNINVPACRFYARQGCTLGIIHRFAYAEFPNEVELVWYRNIE